jgi:hypothetical protein
MTERDKSANELVRTLDGWMNEAVHGILDLYTRISIS